MTGRKKHAQRSKYSHYKKIPFDMFEREGLARAVISDAEKPNGSGLFVRFLTAITKPRESRTKREES